MAGLVVSDPDQVCGLLPLPVDNPQIGFIIYFYVPDVPLLLMFNRLKVQSIHI